jgi:hypothetical protein
MMQGQVLPALFRSLAAIVVSQLLLACATPEIRTRSAPHADLAAYHTYAFVARPGTDRAGQRTPATHALEEVVQREMAARGYRLVATDPELLIDFHLSEQRQIHQEWGPTYGGDGTDAGYERYQSLAQNPHSGAPRQWDSGPDIQTYTEGTLTVDVIEGARNEVIWSGSAVGRTNPVARRDSGDALAHAVVEIFDHYPLPPLRTALAR